MLEQERETDIMSASKNVFFSFPKTISPFSKRDERETACLNSAEDEDEGRSGVRASVGLPLPGAR